MILCTAAWWKTHLRRGRIQTAILCLRRIHPFYSVYGTFEFFRDTPSLGNRKPTIGYEQIHLWHTLFHLYRIQIWQTASHGVLMSTEIKLLVCLKFQAGLINCDMPEQIITLYLAITPKELQWLILVIVYSSVLFWPKNLDIWGKKSIFCMVIAIFVNRAYH